MFPPNGVIKNTAWRPEVMPVRKSTTCVWSQIRKNDLICERGQDRDIMKYFKTKEMILKIVEENLVALLSFITNRTCTS